VRPTVVLNALSLAPEGSGVQTYIRELTTALPAELDARLVAIVPRGAESLLRGGLDVRGVAGTSPIGRTARSLLQVVDADLVHGLDTLIPLRTPAATVATVHDLALFDEPGAFPGARGRVKAAGVAASIRRADAVIAVSRFTAERLHSRFRRDCVVVPEAPAAGFAPPAVADVERFRAARGLPERFVAYAGNVEPRKDLPTLADACRAADLPLVVAGGHLSRAPLPAGARALGHLPEADLACLYAAATVVAYVSRYEGFALPPFEALACGAVVMATPVGAVADLAAEAVELVPVGDAAAQAEALRRLGADDDLRAERRGAGLVATRTLSWAATAAATAAVYRTLGVA
jgi:glycosyltransferase involved in cell wall biosynthesis